MSLRDEAAAAAEIEDQTEVVEFEKRLAPAKTSLGRLISYIELGAQFKRGNPAFNTQDRYIPQVRVTFELTGKDNKYEVEIDGEKKELFDRISLTINKSASPKGDFNKLLTAMAYGRENIKHMASMLGESFILDPVHNKGGKDNKVTYVNLRLNNDSPWRVSAPLQHDPVSGNTKKYTAPPGSGEEQLFLWERPTTAQWDSLYIPGEREVFVYEEQKQEDGTVKRVKTDKKEKKTKNYLQELITGADNFEGSPIDALLGGLTDLPTEEEPEAAGELPEPDDNPFDAPDTEEKPDDKSDPNQDAVEEAMELGSEDKSTDDEADLSVLDL